ncbi:conserved exported hypothetical protein [Tenacibaculum litopenaei]|uniref:DUF7151 family protein n=1 Tax=Tenacibaculum litopenaei TaxID=396016 RepID=UPI0038942315
MKKFVIAGLLASLTACSGNDGADGAPGVSSLTKLTDEAAGSNCNYGGVKIETGLDSNTNHTLDPNEVQSTTYVCNGYNSDFQDENRIVLFSSGSGASGTSLEEGRVFGEILKFDKRHWKNATSISYVAWAYSEKSSNTCYVELVNMTDDKVIAKSTLKTNSTRYPGTLLISPELIAELPEKEITLGLRMRTQNNGTTVYMGRKAELIIKR